MKFQPCLTSELAAERGGQHHVCVFSSRANTVDGSLFSRRLAKGEMYIEEGGKGGSDYF